MHAQVTPSALNISNVTTKNIFEARFVISTCAIGVFRLLAQTNVHDILYSRKFDGLAIGDGATKFNFHQSFVKTSQLSNHEEIALFRYFSREESYTSVLLEASPLKNS